MIHVIAIITATPGKRSALLAEVDAVKDLVRAEIGCIEYLPTVDTTNAAVFQTAFGEDTFVVIEKWSSMDTLMAHTRAAHMGAYAEKVKPLMASRVIHVLSPALLDES